MGAFNRAQPECETVTRTYIGCAADCAEEIGRRPELEALPIDPASGIAFDSDPVNPQPRDLEAPT